MGAWVDSGTRVILPADDLREVILWGKLWRAWALDVEEAGSWAE